MNHSIQATQEPDARSGVSAIISLARLSLVFIVLCGILYPLACTGLLQVLVPERANGSLIRDSSGAVIGSELIGQPFDDLRYFHGRISSIGYQAEASGSKNYAPSNPELLERMKASVRDWEHSNPAVPAARLPIDLVTNSASGLDPHITPEAARVQIPRISSLTGIGQAELEKLVSEHTEGRDLGLFGEPRVNVLALNLDLRALLNR
ncbi:potassium-transporting ATPase subunit KdpC [Paenibacillus thiaminolyticus]